MESSGRKVSSSPQYTIQAGEVHSTTARAGARGETEGSPQGKDNPTLTDALSAVNDFPPSSCALLLVVFPKDSPRQGPSGYQWPAILNQGFQFVLANRL